MLSFRPSHALPVVAILSLSAPVSAAGLCQGFGPQTPRDISEKAGANQQSFPLAPPPTEMNLCNIHTHTNAEHKGPGFSIFTGDGEHGGYRCNEARYLNAAELEDPTHGHGAFHGIEPGDTIEVHWVFSSCQVAPGKGLGACLSEGCANPTLRVESQVFLVVNDISALDFNSFDYDPSMESGLHQPKALPVGTGDPVVFLGSTTGPSYNQTTCSPMQVTWSVRPTCAKVNYSTLNAWVENGNVFEEDHSHGVRQLVKAKALLSPIH